MKYTSSHQAVLTIIYVMYVLYYTTHIPGCTVTASCHEYVIQ